MCFTLADRRRNTHVQESSRSGWYFHITFSSFFQAHSFSWWQHILCLVLSKRSLQVLLLSSYHCWLECPPGICEVSSFHSFVRDECRLLAGNSEIGRSSPPSKLVLMLTLTITLTLTLTLILTLLLTLTNSNPNTNLKLLQCISHVPARKLHSSPFVPLRDTFHIDQLHLTTLRSRQ